MTTQVLMIKRDAKGICQSNSRFLGAEVTLTSMTAETAEKGVFQFTDGKFKSNGTRFIPLKEVIFQELEKHSAYFSPDPKIPLTRKLESHLHPENKVLSKLGK